MDSTLNYYVINRQEWAAFHGKSQAPAITDEELDQIRAVNDRISLADVKDIYAPLRHYLAMKIQQFQTEQAEKAAFLEIENKKVPFIIGIAGSVAVGKSTTARLLALMLERAYPNQKVQQMTTDGFIYPTAQLKAKGILDKKGFPESYNMTKLIRFLNDVKSNIGAVKAPKYSHEIYDIIADEYEIVDSPDILIVEGINVLQLPSNQQIYISDFFDFSIFVDAESELIEKWYMERFDVLLDYAKDKPENYYYTYANGSRQEAHQWAHEIWRTVNLKNLTEYILPTRNRADVIFHKTKHHQIDNIYLRKF